jgi:hypothetical protein
VHGTQPIATKSASTFPDGDEIVIFDADAVLPQVTLIALRQLGTLIRF